MNLLIKPYEERTYDYLERLEEQLYERTKEEPLTGIFQEDQVQELKNIGYYLNFNSFSLVEFRL